MEVNPISVGEALFEHHHTLQSFKACKSGLPRGRLTPHTGPVVPERPRDTSSAFPAGCQSSQNAWHFNLSLLNFK